MDVPFSHTWLPFIYLYGVGGFFFLFGMVIIKKSGAINLKKKMHKFWFKTLLYGFFYFMIMHAVLIISATYW
jgi:hypothetical protein